ncbi:MAG: lamin tail domain-containing protein, partial [Elusimicrobia bacterium]|nr:lamin tail domain-containing protein [Elusimicrobiota bacterium]
MIGRGKGVWAGLFLGAFLSAVDLAGAVRINEVAFNEETGSPDWVELFNEGDQPVPVGGWVLDDGDAASGKHIFLPDGLVMPPGVYLTVMVKAAGASIGDFSSGSMTVYSGTATTVSLAATEDQVGLYSARPLSSATVVDFLAWVTDGDYGGALDRAHVTAFLAGLWPEDGAVDLSRPVKGQSVGRRRNGQGVGPAAFQLFTRPTRGASNEPAPSPFASALSVDPARRSFSPFDSDPSYQTTSFYFNAGLTAVKTLRVLDRRGNTVRSLVENDREPGGIDFSGLGS